MPFYTQLNADHCVIAVTETHSALPDSTDLVEIDHLNSALLGSVYENASGTFTAPEPAPEPRRVAVLAFRRRFTSAERAAIEWAAVDRSDQPVAIRQQAAALRSILADQAAAKFIDLDDADTVAGAQGFEAMGLLAAGRAGEIITAPVLPEELP